MLTVVCCTGARRCCTVRKETFEQRYVVSRAFTERCPLGARRHCKFALLFSHRSVADACISYVYWTFVRRGPAQAVSVSGTAARGATSYAEYAWLYWAKHLQCSVNLWAVTETTNPEIVLSERKPEIMATLTAAVCGKAQSFSAEKLHSVFSEAAGFPYFWSPDLDFTTKTITPTGRYSQYYPLRSNEMRLLEVSPARFPDSPLRGKFVVSHIDESHKYVALSYVWGTSQSSGHILVGARSAIT